MSDNVGKKLREKNLAKFENIGGEVNGEKPLLSNFGKELDSGTQIQNAGREFSQEGVFDSPFKNDHFNSKLWGFDLGEVMESQYDENSYNNVLNPHIDFEKLKADNQSAFTKFGALTTQFVGKTAVGVVGNIVGSIYGLGEWIASDDGTVHSLYDNEVTRGLDAFNEQMELKNTVFVNQKDGIGLNANTAKGLSDAFGFIASALASEAIMQTVGNMVAGAGVASTPGRILRYTKQVGRIMKMLDKAGDTEEYLMKMKGLANTVDEMSKIKNMSDLIKHTTTASFNTARRALTTTGYEAGLEARGTKDELIANMTEELEYQIEQSNMSPEEADQYRAAQMVEIEKAANSAGMFTFALNTGVLSISNAMQFPQIFGNSFVKNAALGGVVRKGLMEVGKREGKKAAAKHYLGMVGRIIKNPATEFMEETGQGVISNTALNHYEIMLGDRTHAGVLAPRVNHIADSVLKGIKETYGTSEGLHEGFIGAIVGAVGIPGLKHHGKGRKAKKKLTWHGGVPGSIIEERARYKAEQEAIANLSSMKPSDIVNYNKDNAIRAAIDSQKEDYANLQNNKVEFESVRDNKIFRYTIDRLEKGMESFIDEDVQEMENMSLEDYKKNFGKEEGFTAEEKAKDVENFKQKVEIYKNAYRGVHRHFNLNLMRGDHATKKFTDVLTYAVATEQAYGVRRDELKQRAMALASDEFTKEEIDDLFNSAGVFAPFQQELDQYIGNKVAQRDYDNDVRARERAEIEEAVKDLDGLDQTHVLGLSDKQFNEGIDRALNKLSETDQEKAKPYIEKLAAIRKEYKKARDLGEYRANMSPEVRRMTKNLQELADELNEKANSRLSMSMKEISKAPEKITVAKLQKYLDAKEKLSKALAEEYNGKNVYQKTQDDDTAEDYMREIHEITDRLVTAANVAGHLYGFKNNASEVFTKITRAEFWEDYDNAFRLGKLLEADMKDSKAPDDEFKSKAQEFSELLEFMDKEHEFIVATLPPGMKELFEKKYAELKEWEKKFKVYMELTTQKKTQEEAGVKGNTKNTSKQPEVTSKDNEPKDPKEKPGDAVKRMLGAKGLTKDPEDEEGEDTEDEEEGNGNKSKGGKDAPQPGGTSSSENKGAEGAGSKKSPYVKRKTEREIKENRLSIRENSSFGDYVNFRELIAKGEFKNKAAVTFDLDTEDNFNPNDNSGLQYALDRDDITIPRKFESSKKAAKDSGGHYKTIGVSLIDLEASGLEFTDEELDAIEKITVLEQRGLNADGVPVGVVRIKTKNGVENFDVKFKKPEHKGTLTESYHLGYKKIKDYDALSAKEKETTAHPLAVKNVHDMDVDVYNFIRYAPIQMNVYDKVLSPSNDYQFDIEKGDKHIYNQYLFAADDVRAMAEMEERAYAAYIEKKDAIKARWAEALKNQTADDEHKTYIDAKFRHEIDIAEAQYMSYFNNPHSNFNYRFKLIKQWAFKNNRQIKMKIQNVDQGNLEKYAYEKEKVVDEHNLTTLGYNPANMTIDDFYYSDRYGWYKRADGTPVVEIDDHPFAYMNKTGVSGIMYAKFKDQTGREIPIKLNTAKFDVKHINMMMNVTEQYLSSGNPKGFKTTGLDVDFLNGLTYERFMEFFLRKERGQSRHMLYLKNTFNLIQKNNKTTDILFHVGESGAISVRNLEEFKEKKQSIIDNLFQNRFTINTSFLVKGAKGKEELNQPVLKYYVDNKILNHSFNAGENFDKVYAPGYNKGITISPLDTPDTLPNYESGNSIGKLISELRRSLGSKKKGKFETNLQDIINDVIHKTVNSVARQQQEITDKDPSRTKSTFTDAEIEAFMDIAIDKTIDKKLAEINKVIAEKPYSVKKDDHHKEFKIQPDDSEVDKFLRTIYAIKKRAKGKAFRNRVKIEYQNYNSKSNLIKAFEKPGPLQNFNIARFPSREARDLNEPESQITTFEQYRAMHSMANIIKEITDAGQVVNVNFREDFVKNYKAKHAKDNPDPIPWKVLATKDGKPMKAGSPAANRGYFKTRIVSVDFKEGGPVWKDGALTGGKIVFNMRTLGYKTKTENGKEVYVLDKEGNKIKVSKPEQIVFMAPVDGFPKQNFVTSISLPYVDPVTYEIDMKALEADMAEVNKKSDARKTNIQGSIEDVLNLIGEDPFKYKNTAKDDGTATDEEIEELKGKRKRNLSATSPSTVATENVEEEEVAFDVASLKKGTAMNKINIFILPAVLNYKKGTEVPNKARLTAFLKDLGIHNSDQLIAAYDFITREGLITNAVVKKDIKLLENNFNTFAIALLGPTKAKKC